MITFLTTFTQKTETIRTNRFFVTYQRMYLSRFLSPFRAFKSVSLKLKPKKEKKWKFGSFIWIRIFALLYSVTSWNYTVAYFARSRDLIW